MSNGTPGAIGNRAGGSRRLRDAVEALRTEGFLIEIDQEVDPIFELAAYVDAARGWPILFHRVRGAEFPALYNLFGQVEWLARWMGVEAGSLVQAFHDACDRPGQTTTGTL